ncbi:hypothetical protein [Pelagicoccus sp. SDUM812003]|uniref:hypothetical protein n=1 Tax=Pelagicoccus sp. SDUM812003 TaxID=3041267 RepID=UPI00280D2C05|nr:hypothetical protein [Pelagicoccus sp. SDUM812003]MDQ8205812.1 hypothetical protein [Pelagicoccus sp. SDUM812003]
MKPITIILVYLILFAADPVSGEKRDRGLFDPIPISEDEVLKREIVEKEKLIELINPDFDIWYQGTWSDWHLFSYRGGFTHGDWTSLDPMYQGVFRCSVDEVKVKEDRVVDLKNGEFISTFDVQKVEAFDVENSAILTKQSFSEESGISNRPEPVVPYNSGQSLRD